MTESLEAVAAALAAQDGCDGADIPHSYRREAGELIEGLKGRGFRVEALPAGEPDVVTW